MVLLSFTILQCKNYNCTFEFLRRMTRSDTLDVYKVKNESVNNTKQFIHFNFSYFKKLCYDKMIKKLTRSDTLRFGHLSFSTGWTSLCGPPSLNESFWRSYSHKVPLSSPQQTRPFSGK
jgi:hypothetical protein